jgi:hypothetical protein
MPLDLSSSAAPAAAPASAAPVSLAAPASAPAAVSAGQNKILSKDIQEQIAVNKFHYNAFTKAKDDFTSNGKKISLTLIKNAILEALELDFSIFDVKSQDLKVDKETNDYDTQFEFDNPHHRSIIEQVAISLKQDSALNKAIIAMVAPENKNLELETKRKLRDLKTNLGVLQGLVLREKLKRGSALNIDPLLDALNDKVKTLSSILAVQKTGNVNFQLGGSTTKFNNLSKYVKYKMKYLTLKNRK